jgi:LuxR family maltose regulon positive regulatory protein
VAERPATAASEAAAATPNVLLATKLNVPGLQPEFVARPRLTERLDECPGRGLMLVCAPAGYGKTVLLSDWARGGQRPVAWLSLDVGDNDPARFWRHCVAALDRARPGLAERVRPLLGASAPPSYEVLTTTLINELAAGPSADEVLLVLDDYHLIDSGGVHESLWFLLEHKPPGLHLVLASRSDPPLPLARLRGRGQLTELRAAELRFTADEAAALLRHMTAEAGAALPEAAVAALESRTEGWAAGLQLAGLSLRGQSDVVGFVAAFAGTHRHILDFLAEEVLERQTEQVRGFLLETSVLERLSGALCDAVTGRPHSQALLERVERAGLFLVPLDEIRGWWRYHHLFGDLLHARLQAEQPARVAELHRNAAAWYQNHGLADEAIRHAVAAGEMTWTARLIEQHFDTVYSLRGEAATIHRWLAAMPAGLIESRPRLLLAQAQLAAASGRLDAVEPLLDAAEHAAAGAAEEPFDPTIGRAASLLVNLPALKALCQAYLAQYRGDAEATAVLASRALAESGEGTLPGSIAQGFLAVAEWLRGHLAAAEHAFVASIAGFRAADQHTTTAWSGYSLVQIQRAQGRLDAAARTCQQMLQITAGPGRQPLAAGPGYVGLAEMAYQRNELDIALQQVTEGIELCRQFAYTPPLAAGLVTLAWIRQATSDPAEALAAIGEAGQASPGPPGLLNPVPAQRARLLLAQGDLAAAVRWTEERGLGADDDPDYPREPGYLVLARVLLAQGQPGQALALLDRLHAAAAAQDRAGSLIEIGALRALALAASGDEDGAVDALAGTLALAYPQGYVRVFADEGRRWPRCWAG